MFGQPAVDQFLKNSNLTLIIRGHEGIFSLIWKKFKLIILLDQVDGMQLNLNGKGFFINVFLSCFKSFYMKNSIYRLFIFEL
jgi:hypothetical protein